MHETHSHRRLTGWGRATGSVAEVHEGVDTEGIRRLVRAANARGVLARGLGRSYGDAAQNGGGRVLRTVTGEPRIELDSALQMVRVPAGASLDQLMRRLLPRGWRLPVLPGTRYVTVGGAIAADVHGKNHHADGSFGRWVRELTLVDGCGDVRRLAPDDDAEAFWATVAGMGLTGVVTEATVAVEPVVSTLMRVRTRRFTGLEAVLDAMESSTDRYHVAWVDASRGRGFGRSVLDEGDHHDVPDAALQFAPRRPVPVPPMPLSAVSPWTVRAFNELWWRRAPVDRTSLTPTTTFFHPLDVAAAWHRVYGPRGFLQWQMAVPFAGRALVQRSLRLLADSGAAPALVVLKRFGESSPAPLSFPIAGWTLAVDLPAGHQALPALLDRLDDEVADAGGRIYLAKDARMRRQAFARMYPRLAAWQATRHRLDPHGVFRSDLAVRLGLL